MTRLKREIKDLLIEYIHKYSQRIIDSQNEQNVINSFNTELAAKAVINALDKKITNKDKEWVNSQDGFDTIKDFFDKRLIINYFMMKRNIKYHEAKSLLIDKGVDAFPETKGITTTIYHGKYKDYNATIGQKQYIVDLINNSIEHEDELTAREANQIIKCLKNKNRTKPFYYTYYIK